jgi:tryptophan-rich sensory protein
MKIWYKNLNKSSLTPPDYVFGVVWSILYTLITISFFIYINSFYTNKGLILFFIQLFLNLLWPYLFFEKKLLCISLLNLVLLNIFTYFTYVEFNKSSNISSSLLVPYMIWIAFALYLNSHICFYN